MRRQRPVVALFAVLGGVLGFVWRSRALLFPAISRPYDRMSRITMWKNGK
jgi:hypothetical protein